MRWHSFSDRILVYLSHRAPSAERLPRKADQKKAIQQISNKPNVDLQDYYLHNISQFRPYNLVYVDESRCDKRAGRRQAGWSPLGVISGPSSNIRVPAGTAIPDLASICSRWHCPFPDIPGVNQWLHLQGLYWTTAASLW